MFLNHSIQKSCSSKKDVLPPIDPLVILYFLDHIPHNCMEHWRNVWSSSVWEGCHCKPCRVKGVLSKIFGILADMQTHLWTLQPQSVKLETCDQVSTDQELQFRLTAWRLTRGTSWVGLGGLRLAWVWPWLPLLEVLRLLLDVQCVKSFATPRNQYDYFLASSGWCASPSITDYYPRVFPLPHDVGIFNV